MKKTLKFASLMLLASAVLFACTKPETPKEAASIKADKTDVAATAEAGSETIAITQNQGFTASVTAGADWLSVEAASDYKNVTLKWTANEGAERVGEVTLKQDAALWKFTVTQAAAPEKDPDIQVAFTLAGTMPDMGMVVYQFAEGAFNVVPEGRTVIFKFKTMNGQVRLMDGQNQALLYRNITPDLTVAISVDSFQEALAAGGRLLIIGEGALENELKGVYVTKEAQIEYAFQGSMPDMGMVIYALPENALKDVQYGDVVVINFKSIGLVNGDEVTPNQVRLLDGQNQALLYREITPDNNIAFVFNKDEIEGNVVDMATISRIMIIGAGALENEIKGISYAHLPAEE